MKIVITDAASLEGNGVTLDRIADFGEVTSYDATSPEDACERIKHAEILLCNKTPVTEETLRAAKNLKYIGLLATGYNNIDLETAKELGITVCNAGGYSTDAVAQLIFGYMLEKYCRLSDYSDFAAVGGWRNCRTFSPILFETHELAGKTLGIVGFGAIGKKVAKIADAFSMKVICYTRTPRECDYVKFVTFDELLEESDIISVNCPLTDSTREMFGEKEFGRMKKTAYFINTSRGAVIDEYALAKAVREGEISGAALDVLTVEPMDAYCALQGIRNIKITPHTAWTPVETRERLVDIVYNNIKAYLEGEPLNRIV